MLPGLTVLVQLQSWSSSSDASFNQDEKSKFQHSWSPIPVPSMVFRNPWAAQVSLWNSIIPSPVSVPESQFSVPAQPKENFSAGRILTDVLCLLIPFLWS